MSGRRFGALTAGPFVLSALLAIALGPSVIDSPHGSFSWLELASLAAAALMFRASAGLRLPVGLATLGSFPVLAGLGFNFAPDWARPLVAIIFYGSIAASVLAVFAGAAAIVGPLYRRGRGAFAGLTAMLLLVPLAIAAGTAAPSGATERPSPAGAHANNMGLVINT